MDGYLPGPFCVSGPFQAWTYHERRTFLRPRTEVCSEIFAADEHSGCGGSFFVEMGEFTSVHMTVGQGFTYVLGMIVAGITGYLVIRFMLKLSNQVRLRYFAFYSFAAGILILAANYI